MREISDSRFHETGATANRTNLCSHILPKPRAFYFVCVELLISISCRNPVVIWRILIVSNLIPLSTKVSSCAPLRSVCESQLAMIELAHIQPHQFIGKSARRAARLAKVETMGHMRYSVTEPNKSVVNVAPLSTTNNLEIMRRHSNAPSERWTAEHDRSKQRTNCKLAGEH